MYVVRKSLISGIVRGRHLPITQDELDAYENEGKPIQQVFPHLSDEEREFILTGITQEEWDTLQDDQETEPEEGDDR